MPMRPGMRMLLMDQVRQRPENNRSEYGGGNRRMIGYDRESNGNAARANPPNMGGSRFENYGEGYEGGNARYAENRMEYGGGTSGYGNRMEYGMEEPESRRRRDSRGRYMMNDEPEMYNQRWYPPNGNNPQMMHPGNSYSDVYAKGTIYAPGAMNRPMHDNMDEDMTKPVDEHTARKWVKKMDGGEHFKPEQIEHLRMAMCPDCNMWSFYVAINAMYSDYCETAKDLGVDTPEFFAGLARDFLKDKDAKPHKLRRYMEYIAK